MTYRLIALLCAVCIFAITSTLIAIPPDINNLKSESNLNTSPDNKLLHEKLNIVSPEQGNSSVYDNSVAWINENPCDDDLAQIPPNDKPSAEIAASLADCSSEDFYWGINAPVDFVKARQCAYHERDRKDYDYRLGGSGLLIMIYANGKGVNSNLDLAIRFACEFDGSDSERNSILHSLKELRKDTGKGEDFDICSHAMSAFTSAFCGGLAERIKESERRSSLSALMKSWSNRDSKVFKMLEKSFDSYVKLHEKNEVHCGCNSWCAVMRIEQRGILQDDFSLDIYNAENSNCPQFSKKDFEKADKRLRKVYRKYMKEFSRDNLDAMCAPVSSDGISKTQKAWLKYMDAWVDFAKIRYPKVSAESWKTWLIKRRIETLSQL